MKVKVFAKVNLTLNVGDKVGNFHQIDSVVTSVNLYDVVKVTKRSDDVVTVSGVPNVATESNTAYLVAQKFRQAFGCSGVDISITKGIPMGAGLGGSSADGAGVAYCLCKLFGVDVKNQQVYNLCASVGSDVNFMLRGGLARISGKGDDVQTLCLPKPLYFALTTFCEQTSTAQVYQTFDKVGGCPFANNDDVVSQLTNGRLKDALPQFCNCLQQSATAVSNYASGYLQFVTSLGWQCNLTGSGSAYYVACKSRANATQIASTLNANGFATQVVASKSVGIQIVSL